MITTSELRYIACGAMPWGSLAAFSPAAETKPPPEEGIVSILIAVLFSCTYRYFLLRALPDS